jgi:hypothetical protein
MRIISQLEQAEALDRVVTPAAVGQRGRGRLPDRSLARQRLPGIRRLLARGPATAPQPAFETRARDGVIQLCLPGVG